MTEAIPRSLPAPGWRRLEPHELIQRGDVVRGTDSGTIFRAHDIGQRANHALPLEYYRKGEAVNELPRTLPAPGWRKLKGHELIRKGDLLFAINSCAYPAADIGERADHLSHSSYYRKEEAMPNNEQKIEQLKILIEEFRAAGVNFFEEVQRITAEAKPLWRDGTEIKVGDWLVWDDYVEGAPADYGPVTHIDGGQIRIGCWVFRDEIKKLERISAKPEVPGYEVLEPRDVKMGDTYWGTDNMIHTAVFDAKPGYPRWILKKIQPKYRPFKDAAEASACLHRSVYHKGVGYRWVLWNTESALLITHGDVKPVVIPGVTACRPAGYITLADLHAMFTFENGNPVGVKLE